VRWSALVAIFLDELQRAAALLGEFVSDQDKQQDKKGVEQ
jgi:hypothetical protein